MFRRFSVNFAIFSILLDAVLVAASLWLASALRHPLNTLPFVQELPASTRTPLALYLFFPLVWVLVLLLFSVYDGRRNLRWVDEVISLSLGSALAAIASAGALYLSFREVSRFLFLLFVASASVSLLSWRILARLALRWQAFRPENRRLLILGAGTVGQQLREQILQHAEFGLSFVGFLDDEREHEDVIGYLSDVRKMIREKNISDVVIALPGWAYERVNHLVAELHDLPVKVWVIPDYFSLTLFRATVEDIAGIPMLDVRAPALSDYQRLTKRAFDLLLTLLVLPPSIIMMGLIAAAIRLGGPGPVLLRQQRVGENGRLFVMYKFRSMVVNATELRHMVEQVDDEGNFVHKRLDDPRVTRVGRFLRRSSLDELPQLLNVLKGEMSLVGPRPELPYLVDKYEPWQRSRFAIPQGITGWWQIHGRSDRPMHLHTEDDLYYVQNYSMLLDLRILLRTLWVVLRREGAF